MEDSGDMEEAQARLLAQSDQYFQQALVHLQTPIPLEAQIIAVLDMQAYQVGSSLLSGWVCQADRFSLLAVRPVGRCSSSRHPVARRVLRHGSFRFTVRGRLYLSFTQ